MNKCLISGRLAQGPELKYTPADVPVSSGCLAVKRKKKNENGEYPVDFINFTAWNQSAEYLCKYAHKGDYVAVAGELRINKFQDKEGKTKVKMELHAHEVELVQNKIESSPQPDKYKPEFTPTADADLPF